MGGGVFFFPASLAIGRIIEFNLRFGVSLCPDRQGATLKVKPFIIHDWKNTQDLLCDDEPLLPLFCSY